jgi:hypothetical protein
MQVQYRRQVSHSTLADLKKKLLGGSPSYVDIRSRANTTRGLDYEHMIKARAHRKG